MKKIFDTDVYQLIIYLLPMVVLITYGYNSFFFRNEYLSVVFLPFLSVVSIVMLLYTILAIKRIEKKSKMKNQKVIFNDYLRHMEVLLHNGASQRHEYARHLQSLQALIDMGLFEKAMEYINGIARTLNINEHMYNVGLVEINSLVNAKHETAKNKNIDFEVEVKFLLSDVDIPSWNLCSILGNLLDNAFEAAVCDHNDPKVKIVFDRSGNYSVIRVSNNGSKIDDAERILQAGVSGKSGERGYGLYIVEKLVRECKGKLLIETEPVTIFTVYIPTKTK
ncbi:MAG: GHKL domain-containing protein [Syntrophomonadaceae bacterium]|jgi:sensor histidine kinase regulating citrate/malate metabolism|nr:GHKL domain-containing protein [Syntrophomonadaceae bacterium]